MGNCLRLGLGALAATLLMAQPAAAVSDRYAAPASTDVSGSCTSAVPCRIDHAIEAASAGDRVIVTPGTYTIDYRISPASPVNVEGEAGQPRPRLVGSWNPLDAAPAVIELMNGGAVRHLYVESPSVLQRGMDLSGVTAEDLIVVSRGDDALAVSSNGAPMVLRDSIVRNTFPGMAAVSAEEAPGAGADIDLRNVSAVATGVGGYGLESTVTQSTVRLKNVIARGGFGGKDLTSSFNPLEVSHSNYRPADAVLVSDLGGNQAGDPFFVDAAAGDLHTFSDSPTVNAGVSDALAGAADPDGNPRDMGGAPNIGAFEATIERPPAPSRPAPEPSGEAPAPLLGLTVTVGVESGSVLVRLPGSNRFAALLDSASIPVGSLVDARRGTVRLASARDAAGRSQTGLFRGSMFRVSQRRARGAYTELRLAGGNLAACRRPAPGPGRASISRRRPRTARRLWGKSNKGRFRTRGRHGAATVRGTIWTTVDRCDGTLVSVARGKVLVKDLRRNRSRMVTAGKRYLARP